MTTKGWNELNGTEQFTVERVGNMIDIGEIPKNDIEELEFCIRSVMNCYEEANEFLEKYNPMYREEGDYRKVRDFLINNNRY